MGFPKLGALLCFVCFTAGKKTEGESRIPRQSKFAPACWGAYKSKVCLSFPRYGNLSEPRQAQGFVSMQQDITLIVWTGLTLHVPELITFCAHLQKHLFVVLSVWMIHLFVCRWIRPSVDSPIYTHTYESYICVYTVRTHQVLHVDNSQCICVHLYTAVLHVLPELGCTRIHDPYTELCHYAHRRRGCQSHFSKVSRRWTGQSAACSLWRVTGATARQ